MEETKTKGMSNFHDFKGSNTENNLPSQAGKGYLERDKGIKKEEDDGIVEFKCIKNNKDPE